MNIKQAVTNLIQRAGYRITRVHDPERYFHSWSYLRHSSRRLEHLASLGLPLAGKTVLEVGAGIGDHTHFYLDRGCRVTVTEAREDNLAYLRRRYPGLVVRHLDLDAPDQSFTDKFEVVHCYGLLYHLSDPAGAIRYMAARNSSLLLLETCVSFGGGFDEHRVAEPRESPTQSVTGVGCRPTREWVFAELAAHYEHVYCAKTQPNHDEFSLDWTDPGAHRAELCRTVFFASRMPLDNPQLVRELPSRQVRHP